MDINDTVPQESTPPASLPIPPIVELVQEVKTNPVKTHNRLIQKKKSDIWEQLALSL